MCQSRRSHAPWPGAPGLREGAFRSPCEPPLDAVPFPSCVVFLCHSLPLFLNAFLPISGLSPCVVLPFRRRSNVRAPFLLQLLSSALRSCRVPWVQWEAGLLYRLFDIEQWPSASGDTCACDPGGSWRRGRGASDALPPAPGTPAENCLAPPAMVPRGRDPALGFIYKCLSTSQDLKTCLRV